MSTPNRRTCASATATVARPPATASFVPSPADDFDRQPRRDDHAAGDRQHLHAGVQRPVAQDGLHVGRQEVHDAHQREEHERDRELAALKRGLRKTRTSSIGCALRRSHATNAAMIAAPAANAARIDRGAPAAVRRLDEAPDDRRQPGGRQPRAERGRAAALRGRATRARAPRRPTSASATTGMLTRKIAVPVEVLEQPAAGDRPGGDAEPGHPGPDRDGLGPLVRREDVRQDRERRRHDRRGAEAHQRA